MFDQLYLEREVSYLYEKDSQRHLPFAGVKNFRDLGGYQTIDGRIVRWKKLYRSGSLHKLTSRDLKFLATLSLERVIDLRAEHEKRQKPDRLPMDANIRRVEIPILDSSTRVWRNFRQEYAEHSKHIAPSKYMLETNIELATIFTPEMKRFVCEVLSADSHPVLFHCTAGKDRTGFAAAILLRILGVPQEVVMEDYLLSNRYFLATQKWNMAMARLLKGKRFVDAVMDFMQVRPGYLNAGFEMIDHEHGSFENYIYHGLELTKHDIERLKSTYLK